jgi:hypothetical protein
MAIDRSSKQQEEARGGESNNAKSKERSSKQIDGANRSTGAKNWIKIKHELRVREREKAYALIPC